MELLLVGPTDYCGSNNTSTGCWMLNTGGGTNSKYTNGSN